MTMKIGLRLFIPSALGVCLLQSPSSAKAQPMARTNAPAAKEDKSVFPDDREKASYAIGMYFGNQIKRSKLDVDLDKVIEGIKGEMPGSEPKLSEQDAQSAIRAYQMANQQKLMEENRKLAEKNRAAGDAFLAENKKKPGVQTMEVPLPGPGGKTAELQYKVIAEGTGEIPKSNDTVEVNYKGTTIDGKEFDGSEKHGRPLKQAANSLIHGWTAALERMKVGSKWQLFIPASLAYGDSAPPGIEPGSTLIFDMELLSVEHAKPVSMAPPGPTQPLTSDIIRVPSAEELKKGAKIEVIKAEDAAKMAEQEAAKQRAATNQASKQ